MIINKIICNSLKKVGNRFDLVLISSYRAKQIQIFYKNNYIKKYNNDKPTILALKEIEKGLINKNILNNIFNEKENSFNI